MKKQTVFISAMLFVPLAISKVTYKDAVQSSSEFHESNKVVDIKPDHSGLGPGEKQEKTRSDNQLGTWVKIGSEVITFREARGYASNLIAPSSVGEECLLGAKGMIANEKIGSRKLCLHQTSGQCDVSTTELFNYLTRDEGYKAECQ